MKKGSKSFLPVIVVLICLLCVSSVGATDHIPFNRGKQLSLNFLQKDKVTRLADLPGTAREKISQQLRKAEYEVSRCERTLPSGKGSLYRALNRNQKLSAYFSGQGVQLLPHGRGEPGWHLQMTLYGYGYDGSVKPLQSVKSNVMKASGCRIECRRGVLTEWYVNDESGIEQGVTLNEPPEGSHRGPLLVEWIVSGSLEPQIERQGEELTFDKPDGSQVLRYSGIKAWDVTGRFLPAKLTVPKGASNEPISRINYVVDDDGACYPVTIDPVFTQVRKINSSDGANYDNFGKSVAIDGDTVVVGASGNIGDGSESGSAYIFDRNQGGTNNWVEVKKIIPSDGANYDNFGGSVAIDGDTVVVGASGNIGDGSESGSAYIFDRNQGGTNNWVEVKKIIPSDGAANDEFGGSVAIDGDTVVVGAAAKNIHPSQGYPYGAAYIFQRDQGGTENWGEVQKITASDAGWGHVFGSSVTIDDGTVVIGAPGGKKDIYTSSGAAYVFLAYALYEPDLVVQSIVTDPSEPVAGQTVGVSITVKNIGVVGANTPFYVHWYANRTSAPSPGLGSGNQYEQFPSLAAGETCTMNTTWTYSSAGDYNMWAYVDYEELVTESDETNNVLGPENILIGVCQGDFDVNGDVDGSDLAVFSADFGRTDCSGDCEGDFDENGNIDRSDLAVFAADFGRTDCPFHE